MRFNQMFAFAGHDHHDHQGRRGRRWGGGPPWAGAGFGASWGGRQRRGDVKYLVLETLEEGPKHGYEVIRSLEERRGIRPSAGSVYPTLQMLEDGGFVTSEQLEGKRVYSITQAGRDLIANRTEETTEEDEAGEPDARHRLKEAAFKLGAAVMSARGADEATMEKIRAVVDKARKDVYAILASDET